MVKPSFLWSSPKIVAKVQGVSGEDLFFGFYHCKWISLGYLLNCIGRQHWLYSILLRYTVLWYHNIQGLNAVRFLSQSKEKILHIWEKPGKIMYRSEKVLDFLQLSKT